MRRFVAAGACLLLAGCGERIPVDLCKHAAVRRQVYVTTIAGVAAYAASARPVPSAMALGREAALTALTVLDLNCPPPAR